MNYRRQRSVCETSSYHLTGSYLRGIAQKPAIGSESHGIPPLQQELRVEVPELLFQQVNTVMLKLFLCTTGRAERLDKTVKPVYLTFAYRLKSQRQGRGKAQKTLLLPSQTIGHRARNTLGEVVHADGRYKHTVDKKSRNSSRRFKMSVGHMVEHRLVAFVSYTGDDGQRHLSNTRRQRIGIEVGKVADGSASANDDNGIPLFLLLGYLLQSSNYALLHPVALHDGRKEPEREMETVFVVVQLIAEVSVTGGRRTANDGDTLRKQGQWQFRIVVKNTIFLQLTQDFLTAAGHVTEGIGGVDAEYIETITVLLMERDFHFQHHFHTGPQRLPCHRLELTRQTTISRCPTRDTGLGHNPFPGLFVSFYEFPVKVSAIARTPFRKFTLHPIGIRETQLKGLTNKSIEFE